MSSLDNQSPEYRRSTSFVDVIGSIKTVFERRVCKIHDYSEFQLSSSVLIIMTRLYEIQGYLRSIDSSNLKSIKFENISIIHDPPSYKTFKPEFINFQDPRSARSLSISSIKIPTSSPQHPKISTVHDLRQLLHPIDPSNINSRIRSAISIDLCR